MHTEKNHAINSIQFQFVYICVYEKKWSTGVEKKIKHHTAYHSHYLLHYFKKIIIILTGLTRPVAQKVFHRATTQSHLSEMSSSDQQQLPNTTAHIFPQQNQLTGAGDGDELNPAANSWLKSRYTPLAIF